mmetsp:Transcript_34662/g.73527  ORF Transcript_34662/g.73527 Transcript_34662/m.73527 type:complete len:102 (+) Transcript_34662:162-467(+)
MSAELQPRMHRMVSLASGRDYAGANQEYISLTVGTAKWHQDFMNGEARHNKGFNMRKVFKDKKAAILDSDEAKAFLQALRRLIVVAQKARPSEDASRHISL